jgi:hypothetical protein
MLPPRRRCGQQQEHGARVQQERHHKREPSQDCLTVGAHQGRQIAQPALAPPRQCGTRHHCLPCAPAVRPAPSHTLTTSSARALRCWSASAIAECGRRVLDRAICLRNAAVEVGHGARLHADVRVSAALPADAAGDRVTDVRLARRSYAPVALGPVSTATRTIRLPGAPGRRPEPGGRRACPVRDAYRYDRPQRADEGQMPAIPAERLASASADITRAHSQIVIYVLATLRLFRSLQFRSETPRRLSALRPPRAQGLAGAYPPPARFSRYLTVTREAVRCACTGRAAGAVMVRQCGVGAGVSITGKRAGATQGPR